MPPSPTTIMDLATQRAILLQYLRSKLDAGDMHGVMDAAADIREIDAALEVLRERERGQHG